MVTVAERIKYKHLCEKEYGLSQGNGPVAVDPKAAAAKARKVVKKSDGFSGGERDLYKEFAQIQRRRQKEAEAEEQARKTFLQEKEYDSAPKANFILKN